MKIKRIEDVNLDSKTVLVRVDYNVPIKDGLVTDNTRIVSTEKTIKYLLEKNCKIVLMAHLGRPKGQVVEEFSLKPVVPEIERVMGEYNKLINQYKTNQRKNIQMIKTRKVQEVF